MPALLSVSHSVCVPWFCLSVYIIWYLASFTTLSPSWRGWGPSGRGWGPSRNGMRGVCEGWLPCDSCQQALIGLDRWMPRTETDLPLSLVYVSQALFHPLLNYVAFSLLTLIPRCSGQKCSDFYCWCWVVGFASFQPLNNDWFKEKQSKIVQAVCKYNKNLDLGLLEVLKILDLAQQ